MSERRSIAKGLIFEQGKKIYLSIIAILFTYLIANFLRPTSYGEVIYFISLTASLQTLSTIPLFENIIFIFVSRYKSKEIFDKLIKYQFLFNLLLAAVLFLFAENIVAFVNQKNVFLFRIAVLLLIFMSIYMSFLALCRAFKSFGKLFKVQSLMQTIGLVCAVFLILFLGVGNVGVIIAQLIAAFLAILILFSHYLKFNYVIKKFDYKKEILTYLKPIIPSYFIRTLNDFLTLIVIGIYSNPLIMGYYFFAEKMVNVILGKTKSTLMDVLTSYTLEKWEKKEVLAKYVSLGVKLTFIFSMVIGIALLAIIWLFLNIFMPAYNASFSLIALFFLNSVILSLSFIDRVFIALNKINFILKTRLIAILIYVPLLFYLASLYSLYGVLYAMILINLIMGTLLHYYSKTIDVPVDVIPTLKDIKYFIQFLKFKNVKSIAKEIFRGIKK